MVLRSWKHERERTSITRQLATRTAHVVHVTHNDLDAVGADAIHRIRYTNVFTIFSSVGKYPHYLDMLAELPGNGDTISISDLSYRPGAEYPVARAKETGWKIEWRHHHRWTDEEVHTIQSRVDILHIDTGSCGCGICAKDLLPCDVIGEEIARVVCDYDLWRHQDPRSHVLGLVLQERNNREYVRDCLVLGVFRDKTIDEEYAKITDKMNRVKEKTRTDASVFQKKKTVVVAPMYGYPSETAAYLREQLNSDIEVLVSKRGKFSIRSKDPVSHLIAREYGGGGHPHAAGGQFSFSVLDRLSLLFLKKNRHFADVANLAEKIRNTRNHR